jgi:hypothetical protein
MNRLAILFAMLLLVLAFPACQTASTTDLAVGGDAGSVENIRLQEDSTLYFPRQPASGDDQMEALLEGQLVFEGGCLRALTSSYESPGFLILWPSTAAPRIAEDGSIELIDDSNQVVGRVGGPVRLGGGAMEDKSSMSLWEKQIDGLPIEGCPGPYWVVGTLYPQSESGATATSHSPATPYSQEPAAGICGEFEGSLVSVSLRQDVPDPRCVRVKADQYLSVKNETDQLLQVSLAHFQAELDPGEEFSFETPFGEYLAPGVHLMITSAPPGGPEIWLVSE